MDHATETLRRSDSLGFRVWAERWEDLARIAEPILMSPAFKRLQDITFLGIISPRYHHLVPHPSLLPFNASRTAVSDGSRHSHSLGVATIVLDICRNLGLGDKAQRYGVAWGLLHDIATWPLSHTGESAFEPITKTNTATCRLKFIFGSPELPESWPLTQPLEESGVEPEILARLFDRRSTFSDRALCDLANIIRSPITPDTLEGIWRSGLAFGVDVPAPTTVQSSLYKDLLDIAVDSRRSKSVLHFWRRKADIYRRFINKPTVVYWESAWSLAIQRAYTGTHLADSLTLSESEIVDKVLQMGLPTDVHFSRFREPIDYFVATPGIRTVSGNRRLSELHKLLRKKKLTGGPMNTADLTAIQTHVKPQSFKILERANRLSLSTLEKAHRLLAARLPQLKIAPETICFAAVGSTGRLEALESSDLDLIPIALSPEVLEAYRSVDETLRRELQDTLGIKVSRGEELTRATDLPSLVDAESIGGDRDGRTPLTQRILVLSESSQAGGMLPLETVRREILKAYAEADRTRGRHVLSFCNDVARYYRTLCIEYKSKVDNEAKDWCTRNMKLRHSRKLWYFSTIVAIASLAAQNPQGDSRFIDELLRELSAPPYLRLFHAAPECPSTVGRVLDRYAWFLEFMADKERRKALSQVEHHARYEVSLQNPFPQMKLNSNAMHAEMLNITRGISPEAHSRLLNWFFL